MPNVEIELNPVDFMCRRIHREKNWPIFVLVQEKIFVMLWLLQEVHLVAGAVEQPSTADRYFTEWQKCWKEEKPSSLMN